MIMTPLIIHHNDLDGLAAAWVVKQRYPDAELMAAQYGDEPPIANVVRDRHVWIVDFSYDAETLRRVAREAASVIVIDHHKSVEKELRAFRVVDRTHILSSDSLSFFRLLAYFDSTRSGCGLAWDLFNPDQPRPELLDYIEDRDIWKWSLPDSHEISAALMSYPLDYAWLDGAIRDKGAVCALLAEGRAILRYQRQLVADHVALAFRTDQWMLDDLGSLKDTCGEIPIALCQLKRLTSDVGHALLTAYPDAPYVAIVLRDYERGVWRVSLRSDNDRADVSEIARARGGGGHRNAAGYEVKL